MVVMCCGVLVLRCADVRIVLLGHVCVVLSFVWLRCVALRCCCGVLC